jgi:hypothetical protein
MNRFSRWILPSIASVFAVVGAVTPAVAAITTAQLTAGSPASNGPCPFTESFTGSINGTPGTSFQYSFNRYIDSVQQVQNVGVATIPASGTLNVSDSFSISGATAAINFDQIWVHNIAGGQGDVYSPRAPFSVACIAGSPPPAGFVGNGKLLHGSSGLAYQSMYGIPLPTDLKSTTDPQECGKHGGLAGLFCIQAVPDKYLILVWDWQPNDKWPAIDGYHIYDVTNGAKTRVQDQTNPQATVEFFEPGSFAGKCYAVTAYKGTTESATSASFCAGVAMGLKTISDMNPISGSRHKAYSLGGGGVPNGDCPMPCIGYTFDKTITLGVVQSHDNLVRRGYYTFHPNGVALRGLNIAKATLTVTRLNPELPAGRGTNSFECFGAIGATRTDWTASSAFADGDFGYDVPASIGTNSATFDVTRIVRDWANGVIPNNGFVFKGLDENTGSDAVDSCELLLAPNATLTIQYF